MDASIWKRHHRHFSSFQGDVSGAVDANALRFDDQRSQSCFRYPHMMKSAAVHSAKAKRYQVAARHDTPPHKALKHDTLWNLAWKADTTQIRKIASTTDIDAMGLCSESFGLYEKGHLKVHYGIFLQSSTVRLHKRLHMKRFIRRRAEDGLEVGMGSAVHWACVKGSCRTVGVLLDVGASQFAVTGCGATPLHIACGNYNIPLVQLLLSRAAGVPKIMIQKCLDLSRGNPYTLLRSGIWLKDEDTSLELHSADPTGVRGVDALQRFLTHETFQTTAMSPVPLPPYIVRG